MAQFSLEIHQKKKPETSRYIKKFQAFLIANWSLSGQGPSILLAQDRSAAYKPPWGFHCCANAEFTAQSASSWGCGKNWLCYRPSDSNNVHEVNPLFNEPSNKLQQRPRKLCTVLVTALF